MPIRPPSTVVGIFNKNFRFYIEKFLMPLALQIKLSPNFISLLAFLSMAFAAALVITHNLFAACIMILISGTLDLLDGLVARAQLSTTVFGAFLDKVTDRAADFLMLASVLIGAHVNIMLGLYVLFVVMLASFISAYLEKATSSDIGQKISLRGIRLAIIAIGCLSDNIRISMLLVALIGTLSVVTRLHIAYKSLTSTT